MRFQGALEYLIILGAAVLIAGIVVAYMFGFLRKGIRHSMITACASFLNKLCIYAVQPQSFGAAYSAQAMAEYLQGALYCVSGEKFVHAVCTVKNETAVTCSCGSNSITFTYLPSVSTIKITGSNANIFEHTNLKLYISNRAMFRGDYVCVNASSSYNFNITCTS